MAGVVVRAVPRSSLSQGSPADMSGAAMRWVASESWKFGIDGNVDETVRQQLLFNRYAAMTAQPGD